MKIKNSRKLIETNESRTAIYLFFVHFWRFIGWLLSINIQLQINYEILFSIRASTKCCFISVVQVLNLFRLFLQGMAKFNHCIFYSTDKTATFITPTLSNVWTHNLHNISLDFDNSVHLNKVKTYFSIDCFFFIPQKWSQIVDGFWISNARFLISSLDIFYLFQQGFVLCF